MTLPLLVSATFATFAGNAAFDDGVVSGTGSDTELFQLLSYARRSIGETNLSVAEYEFQTMPMLYNGAEDGLLEGPTWDAYWTQNSYGTALTCLPFLGDLTFKGMRESQNWWFNNMADGTTSYVSGQGWAPDGCGCDAGRPEFCYFKQGDGNVPIHDWTLEETLSGVVMQAELLLISRNTSAITEFLPQALRTSNLIEGRRDPATQMKMFLSGPSSNLLAPSFGGWQLDNGKHAWSYMTGISVTYSAALMKLIELAKMVRDQDLMTLYSQRLEYNRNGLNEYLAPEGDYFVRSVDPNGTLHGVLGQAKHGYFEASPNHDAVALRVVDDTLASKIVSKIKNLSTLLRPNVFILPNTDATGKPPLAGSGAVGYDDMACGDGPTCGGIFNYGTWVNGGVWTTTEGRWLLAAARMGDIGPARASVKQMISLFASSWRMDNPLVNFGLAPYQPTEDINLTIDNFASAGGLLRGLFEYLYTASTLTLIPHLPDNITAYSQNFKVRWGPYRILLSTVGVTSSGIKGILINSLQPPAGNHKINSTSVVLNFENLPAASPAALAAVNSSISTAYTEINVTILFTNSGGARSIINKRVMERNNSNSVMTIPDLLGQYSALNVPAGMQDGDNITNWPNLVNGGPPLQFPCTGLIQNVSGTTPPTFSNSSADRPALVFNGLSSMMCASGASARLGIEKTFIIVFEALANPINIYSMLVGGTGGAFNGLGISPIGNTSGVQVDIDWIGSTDEARSSPSNVRGKLVIVTVTYNSSVATSFINGCHESEGPGSVAGSSPLGFSAGCREDPYHRCFNGSIHEIAVFNRSLSASERTLMEASIAAKWGITIPEFCPHLNLSCSALLVGPSAPPTALVTKLRTFVRKVSSDAVLSATVAYTMATRSLSYLSAATVRCNGLNDNLVPQLRSMAANTASVNQLLATATSVATGVENYVENTLTRYPSDPTAAALMLAWNASSTFF